MDHACPNMTHCPFFDLGIPNDPGGTEFVKRLYCQSDYRHCARKIVCDALGPDNVPVNLYPHDFQRAQRLIADTPKPTADDDSSPPQMR